MSLRIKGVDRKSLEKEYRKLAKRADQRLVRLEGYRHDKGFEHITSYAYSSAMKDIRKYSGEDANRFNTKPPASDRDLLRKIADIKKFLDAPSSTKKGVVNIYKKRAETLNKNKDIWGDREGNLTWEDYASIFDVMDTQGRDSKFEYNMVIRSAGIMKEYKITKDNVDESLNKLVRTEDIDVIEKQTIKALNANGLTLDKLIRK